MSLKWTGSRHSRTSSSAAASKYSKLSQSEKEEEDESDQSDDESHPSSKQHSLHGATSHSVPSSPSSSAKSGSSKRSKASFKSSNASQTSIIIHTEPIADDEDDAAKPEKPLEVIPQAEEDLTEARKSSAKVSSGTEPVPNINDPSDLTYFRDQKRPVDYVLVYEVSKQDKASGTETDGQRRSHFIHEMELLGINIEQSKASKRSGNVTHFIKLHLPWDTIKDWAEKLHMRVPLQEAPGEITNWSQKVFDVLHIPHHNPFRQDVPAAPLHYYTAQFRADRLQYYVFNQEPDKLFTRPQRSYVIHEMLQSVRYGDENRGEVGLDRLLNEGIIRAAFPLHDGPLYEELPSKAAMKTSKQEPPHQRQILRTYWASFSQVLRYQPMEHIRGYYGEQVALYFSWLGLYNAWLVPLSIIGVLAFLYGYLTISDDPVVEDICHHGHKFTMCPVCDHCPYWRLSQACSAKRLGYVFDNPGTCLSAFLLSLWAVLFVELWKRKNAELTHYFDCDDYHDEEEHPRAEFTRNAPKMRRNVVTGHLEPYFPPTTLMLRRVVSWVSSVSFLLVIFLVTFGVILLRTSISAELTRSHGMESPHRKLANIVAATVTLACLLVLNRFYVIIAQRLTAWEMHRSEREHEDSLAWKAYWFQFVNSFSPVFYIAFIKGRFQGYPGHRRKVAGMMLESCDIGGCFAELGFQLIVLMCGKQIFSNALEFFLPAVVHVVRHRQHRLQSTEPNIIFLDQQYKLAPFNGLTEEYMKMVIQFGFIILFGASFPLAPLFSLLNNILELRMDARKLVLQSRRPLARRAQSIGIWFLVMKWIAMLSVWVNGFLIAYTSETLTQLLYAMQNDGSTVGYMNHSLAHAPIETTSQSCRYEDFRTAKGIRNKFYYELAVFRLAFVLLYVGITYAISTLITSLIPDTPQHVTDAKKRRLFLANQALQSTPAAANEAYAKVRTSTQVNPLARVRVPKARSRSRKPASAPLLTHQELPETAEKTPSSDNILLNIPITHSI